MADKKKKNFIAGAIKHPGISAQSCGEGWRINAAIRRRAQARFRHYGQACTLSDHTDGNESQMKVREHFLQMKAKQKKPKTGLHVLNLPPKVAGIYTEMHKPRFSGQKVSLRCPYCRALNIEGMPFCCNLFRDALMMIREASPVPVMVN